MLLIRSTRLLEIFTPESCTIKKESGITEGKGLLFSADESLAVLAGRPHVSRAIVVRMLQTVRTMLRLLSFGRPGGGCRYLRGQRTMRLELHKKKTIRAAHTRDFGRISDAYPNRRCPLSLDSGGSSVVQKWKTD
jgi:hypothetical protein